MKDGGGRNPVGIGTEQFQKLLDENEAKENNQPTVNIEIPIEFKI